MTVAMYLELFAKALAADEQALTVGDKHRAWCGLSDVIDSMSHTERRELREKLEKQGHPLMRNLAYDYALRVWI